jgi:hypothetical protein
MHLLAKPRQVTCQQHPAVGKSLGLNLYRAEADDDTCGRIIGQFDRRY